MANKAPLVSIVIPTLNRTEWLKHAIASIQAQTWRDYEILVVQNGHEEHSKTLCHSLIEQGLPLRYFYHPAACAGSARNRGIREAVGYHIAFLDDDDVWFPEKLEKQVHAMEKNPSAGLVTCRGIWVDSVLQKTEEIPSRFYGDPTYKDFVQHGCLIYSMSSILVRRICFDRIGLFDTRYLIANDYDFYLRLANKFRIVSVEEPLFRYNWHAGNFSRASLNMGIEIVRILKAQNLSETTDVTNHDIDAAVQNFVLNHYHRIAVSCCDKKQYRDAFRNYLMAVQIDPLIGTRVAWGRFHHDVYKMLRPYLAIIYCALKSISSWEGRLHHGNR